MFKNLAKGTPSEEIDFWQKFLKALRIEDYNKIMKMTNEQLSMGHNPYDIEERLKFINEMPISSSNHVFD